MERKRFFLISLRGSRYKEGVRCATLKYLWLRAAFLLFALSRCGYAAVLEGNSDPKDNPAELRVWPNQTSRANSDTWLAQHHDEIRLMRPRLLLVNFSQEAKPKTLEKLARGIMAAVTEGSRYHGYANSNAPAFLDYRIFKFIDLREPGKTKGNSSKLPVKAGVTGTYNVDHNAFFSESFAKLLDVRDPDKPERFLRLDELVDKGYVHEVWFFIETTPDVVAYECVEEKPQYDEHFQKQGDHYVQAGNGGDSDQKWTGRSVRLGFVNPTRGIGCFLESLSHSIEGTADAGAIPYFTKYFQEYAGRNLKKRFNLSFDSFYDLWGATNGVEYPDEKTAVIRLKGKTNRIENYLAYGGNVHYPPNGRRDYDLENSAPVLSTIEDWRIGSGPDGKDIAIPWTNERFAKYRQLAPDCMGAWLVYWRQNFPGLNNRQKGDAGKPMKNWWPFLFY